MRRSIVLLAAASLSLAGFSFVRADDAPSGSDTAGQKVENAADRAGQAVGNAVDRAGQAMSSSTQPSGTLSQSEMKAIHTTLGQTVDAALTKGGFDDFCERLSKADRSKIGRAAENNWPDLDGRIAQFQTDWKNKYGQDFKLERNLETVFNDQSFRITPGWEQTSVARLSNVNPDQANQNQNQPNANQANQNPDRTHATVTIPASHNMPEMMLHLVNEGRIMNAWRIEVPGNVGAEQLKNALLKHLTEADQPANWPSDVNDAYRAVSHHVFAALNDVSGGTMGGTNTGGSNTGGEMQK